MELQVEVSGIDVRRRGRLTAFFFAADGFPKNHSRALCVLSLPITDERLVFTTNLDFFGRVAIKVLHDDDLSGLVRKRFGFVPDKGLGFSGGARITYRAPRFEEAALVLEKGVELLRIEIQMQYLLPVAVSKRALADGKVL